MRRFSLFIITLLSLFCYLSQAANNKPQGLLTDLLEHTDYTWQNGYASNVPVWQMGNASKSFQYAEIGSAYPSFGWIVPGEANATVQTSYRIIVVDNMEDALSGKGNVWDSGTVESRQSTSVIYAGNALQPGKNYFWRVKTVTNTESCLRTVNVDSEIR